MSFDEFTMRFATEEQCREYLYQLRFPKGFVCPKCGQDGKYWQVGDTLYECGKCGHQTSVIAGTIFQDTRKPMKTWFTAIWWITTMKSGASAMGLQRVLALKSYTTAWTWLHKIRTAMVNPKRLRLEGTVEVDETYIGGEMEGKRGRGSENKALVAVALEIKEGRNQLGRVRMHMVSDASVKSLCGFIKDNVQTGSTVITDGWKGYNQLSDYGFNHVIHPKFDDSESDDETLSHVHLVVSLLKRWLLGTHQGAVREDHLQAYLDEYVFRFNRRKAYNRGLLFYRLLESAMHTPPSTQDEFLGHESCITLVK